MLRYPGERLDRIVVSVRKGMLRRQAIRDGDDSESTPDAQLPAQSVIRVQTAPDESAAVEAVERDAGVLPQQPRPGLLGKRATIRVRAHEPGSVEGGMPIQLAHAT